MGTFFFFLIWYAFFIFAFGLGFYIMLHKRPRGGPISESGGSNRTSTDVVKDEGEEERYKFFDEPWLSLIKTSTMFVGELEFSDIPVDTGLAMAPLGYSFFLSFVFLIVVVLMNLLNGLAVSDTGAIQDKAEIFGYMSRVETISYTESVLLGDPFDFLSNWPAFRWLKRVPSLSFFASLYRSNQVLQSTFHRITGAAGVLLFYAFLPDQAVTIRPNQTRDVCCECLQVRKFV